MKNILFIISKQNYNSDSQEIIKKKNDFLKKQYDSEIFEFSSEKISFDLVNKLNPDIICFDDLVENFEEIELFKIFYQSNFRIFEFVESDLIDITVKNLKPEKFIFTNQNVLKKFISQIEDFDFLDINLKNEQFPLQLKELKNDKIKKGFIVTFFKTHYNNYGDLHVLIKSLNLNNYYIILASHSYIPFYIQNLCDLFIYEDLNLADQRKYSHGVAEISLIEKSLIQLKNLNIEWTYKISYDVLINDVKIFQKWILDYQYDFVSCLWGDCQISTNSFFCNVNFALNNLSFPKTIDEMFKRNSFIEFLWNQDIINKSLQNRIFTYQTKEDMFETNIMDNSVFNYDELHFTFNEQEKRFYISHSGPNSIKGRFAIIDYYSENIIYCGECDLNNYTLWLAPKIEFYLNNLPKNGYYIKIIDEKGEELIRRNLNISDYNFKTKLHKIYRSINCESIKIFNDCKYYEYCDFYNLNIYKKFKIPINQINTFIDAGASLGMFSLELLKHDIKKAYLIEAEPRASKILKDNIETNFIKVINKTLSNKNDFIDFFIFDNDNHNSMNSLLNENNIAINNTIKVESITIDKLFQDFIEEDAIDLFKIDIEGSEYDAFEYFSNENIQKCKMFLIEYHNNTDKRVLKIVDKLTDNNFRVFFQKYYQDQSENFIDNEMGIIYAFK